MEYKLLEWKIIINKKLYDDGIIDLDLFSNMNNLLLNKMNKLKKNNL